jgi:hypothetical protein
MTGPVKPKDFTRGLDLVRSLTEEKLHDCLVAVSTLKLCEDLMMSTMLDEGNPCGITYSEMWGASLILLGKLKDQEESLGNEGSIDLVAREVMGRLLEKLEESDEFGEENST